MNLEVLPIEKVCSICNFNPSKKAKISYKMLRVNNRNDFCYLNYILSSLNSKQKTSSFHGAVQSHQKNSWEFLRKKFITIEVE